MNKNLVLYVHGKGGTAAESAHYEPLFPGCDVSGFDYKSLTPRDAKEEFYPYFKKLASEYESIILIANSIGAFLCMNAGIDKMIKRAYFISPVVDMEKLIQSMMSLSGVTEPELKSKGVIPSSFGEDLSWDYLCYVRENPLKWDAPADILYADGDELTTFETINSFAEAHNASLTVMQNGEHWFHTEEQMRFLDNWIKNMQKKEEIK